MIHSILDAITSFFTPRTQNPYKNTRRYSASGEHELLFDQLSQKGCPDCGCSDFNEGPSAGLSVNIRCANEECHSEFNIMPMGGWAERIKQ